MRSLPMSALMAGLFLTLGACQDKTGEEKTAPQQMQDMGKADGTISDAMTDLDGIRSQSTATADMGNDSGAVAANAASTPPQNAAEADAPEDTEVVADQ